MATYTLAPADVKSFVLPDQWLYSGTSTITLVPDPTKITWSIVPRGSFDYFSVGGGGGGGNPLIAVRDTYIDSSGEPDTAWTGSIPSYIEGDLLVAVIMTRTSGGALTLPTGWTQQGSAYLTNMQFGADAQSLKVFTKVATASEPATVTWTQASSARICGFLVSMVGNDFTMGTAAQAYGNASDASIANAGADFYITAGTWVYAATNEGEVYSQTGPGLTQITDSPARDARISGGYTSKSGLVESVHKAGSDENDPNHGMISIPFIASGGGGGSIRPVSGFLYPRGQG